MAITITDNRIVLSQVDATTGWTATDGPTTFTTGPTPIEATACLGMQASNDIQNAYIAITSDNYSNGGSLFVWMTDRAAFDTTVNGGIGIQVGDGTNRIAYHVGGSDGTGFRHEVGPVKWANFQLDLANKPANFTAIAGSEASLNEAAITQVGVYFETIAKSVGGADNVFWDIIRFADNGVGIEVYGGTIGTPETWLQVTIEDRNEGTLRAHGIIRRVGSGAYSIQGNISIGDATGTASTYINSTSETFLWEDRGQSTNNYYRFNCVGNGTGTTDVNFDACTFICPTSGSINFSNVNVTADVRSSVITGFTQGISTGGSGNVWTGNTYTRCGQLVTTGTNLLNSVFSGYTGAVNTSQLYWNTTTNPSGSINGSSFTMPATATHAIEFPAAMTNQTIDVTDCDFIGYGATNNANDSTFNVLATTGTLTINISGGSGNTSYRTAGATVVIVANPVTLLVKTQTQAGVAIQNTRVLVETGVGGAFPSDVTVTLTRSGSTVTVTHTSHGLSNGDEVVIRGANQNEYIGVHTISNVTTNTYDYTIVGTPTTPATGTIKSTFVLLSGLTDINGEISTSRTYTVNTPISTNSKARKSTGSPYYKTGDIVGTVDKDNGANITVVMLSDE